MLSIGRRFVLFFFFIKNIFLLTGNNSGFSHLKDPVCEFIHVECYPSFSPKYLMLSFEKVPYVEDEYYNFMQN